MSLADAVKGLAQAGQGNTGNGGASGGNAGGVVGGLFGGGAFSNAKFGTSTATPASGNPFATAVANNGGLQGKTTINEKNNLGSLFGGSKGSPASGGVGQPAPVGGAGQPATGSTDGSTGSSAGGSTGGASGGYTGASGSIILEPAQMFQTLQELEKATQDINNMLREIANILEASSMVTFAVGFAELVKIAEGAINQVGSAVVAANNAFNRACKDVVNQLVDKFAAEGAKSDYSEPAFQEVTIRVNVADRAQIYPSLVRVLFDDQQQQDRQLASKTNDMRDIYRQTQNFWLGTAADRTRQAFESRIVPKFEDLLAALNNIVESGLAWVDEAVSFEASLGF